MRALEVIDLLSSPEPVPSRSIDGKDGTEWWCISDDVDDGDCLTTSITQKPTTCDDHISNKSSGILNGVGTRILGASVTSNLNVTSSVDLSSYQATDKVNAIGKEDLFFLSDSFNTTIDPFEALPKPAAKRRRINPNPDMLIGHYSAIQTGERIKRSFSDVAAPARKSPFSATEATGLKRSRTTVLEDDPIVLSSSPTFLHRARERKEKLKSMREQELCDTVDDNDDSLHTHRQGRNVPITTLGEYIDKTHSSSSDLDLPDIGAITSHPSSLKTLSRGNSRKTLAAYESEKIAQQKQMDKTRKTHEKIELKEAEKERKRATKAKDKEIAAGLAKVNTLRIDKKVSTPEMIVDLPAGFDVSLAGQVRQFLNPLEVVCEEWRSPIANVVKWRRKVDAIYNEEVGLWEPVPMEIKSEKHLLCVINAKEFVDLITADEGRDLDAHVSQVKAKFDGYSMTYLIESLTPWMRKNRNIKNRQFTEAVRSRMTQGAEEMAASSNWNGKKKKQQEYVDEDMIEDALLKLQIIHGAQIHHSTSTVDTAQWIMIFTQHISTIPYRLQRMTLDTAFCMESGQVKTGMDASDTYIKMLQEVNRITAPIAYGIAAEYPSAKKLVKGFELEGKDLLQNLKKSANRDGAFTDREIGKKISRRLWGIFMGTDPGSTDV